MRWAYIFPHNISDTIDTEPFLCRYILGEKWFAYQIRVTVTLTLAFRLHDKSTLSGHISTTVRSTNTKLGVNMSWDRSVLGAEIMSLWPGPLSFSFITEHSCVQIIFNTARYTHTNSVSGKILRYRYVKRMLLWGYCDLDLGLLALS